MTDYPTEWTSVRPDVWGPEAKCYQTAVFDKNGNQVGDIATGVLHLSGYNWGSVFGLKVKFRQVKEFKAPAPRKPEQKKMHPVRIEHYSREGDLIDLTVETRMVYTNSKGEFIKTRSNGNPRITYVKDDGTRVIRYEQKFETWVGEISGEVRSRWKAITVTPEEWESRNA